MSAAMRYRTIVVDPPWDHSDGTGWDPGDNDHRRKANALSRGGPRVTGLPYSAMTVDEIKALPVRDLSDNVDQNAHLYLWTTSRYLFDAKTIAEAWGFHYAATLVWCKPSRGFSLGGVFQNNVEFVLFCRSKYVRRPDELKVTSYLADAAAAVGMTPQQVDDEMGTRSMARIWWITRTEHRCACPSWDQWQTLKTILSLDDSMDALVKEINDRKRNGDAPPARATSRWFEWPRQAHSQKPEAFLDIVEQVSPGPYLEMFARRNRLGWDTWGNEALEHVDLGTAALTEMGRYAR